MDFRQRLEHSKVQLVNSNPVDEPDEPQTTTYFATNRANSPACLDLRLGDGSRKAVPYSHIVEISFAPEMGIEIRTTQKTIAITGRQLTALYEALVTYRVRYIQADVGNDAQEDGLFVGAISIHDM